MKAIHAAVESRNGWKGRWNSRAAMCGIALFTAAAACQPGSPSGERTFDQRLQAAFADIEQMNVSAVVGIAHGGRPLVIREFGATADDGVPASSTQVDINSITKTVTAVMILKLVEQDRLRLDETLAEIFPAVPQDKAKITIHQLLTHSAGFVEAVGHDDERLSKEDFLRRVFASELRQAPGVEYHYTNAGYSLLAAVIEARSGKSYEDYLHQDVLPGTGLGSTGYMSVYEESRSLRSANGKGIMTASWGGHEPYWNLVGNGGLISTTEDFIRFLQALQAGEILAPKLVHLSHRPHVAETADGASHYGYGLVVMDAPELGRVYWHDGGNDIYSAMWAHCVDQGDIIFTAAADSAAGDAFVVMSVIRKHLYGQADR